jgi:hypothetical protein
MLTMIDLPSQARNAFLLLWAVLALTTIEAVIWQFEDGFGEEEPVDIYLSWGFLAIYVALAWMNAYFIYCASRRRNWARIALLALFLLPEALLSATYVLWPETWTDDDFWSAATTSAYFVMNSIALFWLFSGAGAKWYAAKDV